MRQVSWLIDSRGTWLIMPANLKVHTGFRLNVYVLAGKQKLEGLLKEIEPGSLEKQTYWVERESSLA